MVAGLQNSGLAGTGIGARGGEYERVGEHIRKTRAWLVETQSLGFW